MSPFPVCKDALEALVELCGPFGMRPDSSLLQELDTRSCSPLMLLLCADALCLTTVARAAFDRWFAHMLECTPSLLELQAGGNFIAFGRNEHDCCVNLKLSCRWRSDGVLDTQLMPAWNKAACHVRASAVLPAVRWAAMELYKLLDVLCLTSSQDALAAKLFDPQSAVLHADDAWREQLLDLATADQLCGPGRCALIAAGFASDNSFTGSYFGSSKPLTLTMREVLTSGVLLDKGVRMGYDSTSRGCLLSCVIIVDYTPDEA